MIWYITWSRLFNSYKNQSVKITCCGFTDGYLPDYFLKNKCRHSEVAISWIPGRFLQNKQDITLKHRMVKVNEWLSHEYSAKVLTCIVIQSGVCVSLNAEEITTEYVEQGIESILWILLRSKAFPFPYSWYVFCLWPVCSPELGDGWSCIRVCEYQ